MSVDGTDFRICNPTPFSTKWYSHKFHGAGLRYEVALNIQTGDIVWTNGPFPPGRYPDISIFLQDLRGNLDPGERVEADQGYVGWSEYIDCPMDNTGGLQKQVFSKKMVRSRHEHCNARFKLFNALKSPFRHGTDKHGLVFRCVAIITQISFENGDQLAQVTYETLKSAENISEASDDETDTDSDEE